PLVNPPQWEPADQPASRWRRHSGRCEADLALGDAGRRAAPLRAGLVKLSGRPAPSRRWAVLLVSGPSPPPGGEPTAAPAARACPTPASPNGRPASDPSARK